MGLRAQLLRFVLMLAVKMADEVGCAGVVVDAKPGAVDVYAKYGFSVLGEVEGQSEARPMATAMWLPIRAIQRASKESQ
ncbi:MAG: hypothetical protein HY901_12990 [Deltaproteobacteria bacterium]|nr:hypothetical protein [Deltaproteobacteria bacterium]